MERKFRTAVSGSIFPAMSSARGGALLAALTQLEQSQWWPVDKLLRVQQQQLLVLLNHAVQQVPYYQPLLGGLGYQAGQQWDEALWQAIPVLSREALQEQGQQFHSRAMPKGHGKAHPMQSSGSTGKPVQVLGSDLTNFFWDVATLRDHDWQQRDLLQHFAAVRPDRSAKGEDRIEAKGWGAPVDHLYHSGSSLIINSRVDVKTQLRWLAEYQPVYLLTLPSNLRELLHLCRQEKIALPTLQQVRTFGETVSAELRAAVQSQWGVPLSDMYSSQEVGYLALQCPEHDHYHVQGETMYLEVLDDEDRPCAPGQIGRVVVTPLHNFVMPLLRYEVGDYAEVGEPCPCGRGLPVLTRILGRTRNMVRTPSGECYWPSFPVEDWLAIGDVRQFQLRQTALGHIEVMLAMEGELDERQRKQLQEQLHRSLNYPFEIDITYVDAIPRQKNGKYEDFISLL